MTVGDEFGAPPAERVVARLRRHARRLFWPSLVLIVACGGAGYLGFVLTAPWATVAWIGAGVVTVLFFLLPLLSWLATRYTITTRRIVLITGLFVRQRREVLHSRGYSVTLRRSWLQAMFGSGTVIIGGSGQQEMLRLRDIPHAVLVTEALHDLMENSQRSYAPWSDTVVTPRPPTASATDEL
jgi:uncharacterized membrane protein YdbT with pleckstrin-like domain